MWTWTGMAFHPALFHTGRSGAWTSGGPTPGESANRFPVQDLRRRPGRGRPHSPAARASRSAPFLSLPASIIALNFPCADVLPAAPCCTESRVELSPSVARPGRVSTLRPRSPLSPRRYWRHTQVPGEETQAGSVCASSSASERRRCAFGNGEVKGPPPGSAFQELRVGCLAPCF